MRLIQHVLIGWPHFIWFLFPLCFASFCKSKAASKSIAPELKVTSSSLLDHKQKRSLVDGSSVASQVASQKDLFALKDAKHCSSFDKASPISSPIFTFRDGSLAAGSRQSMTLEVMQWASGYSVKSVRIKKVGSEATTTYEKPFGLDRLKGIVIPPQGFIFTLQIPQRFKPGQYRCTFTVGKTGKGSRATRQYITGMIAVLEAVSNPDSEEEERSPVAENQGQLSKEEGVLVPDSTIKRSRVDQSMQTDALGSTERCILADAGMPSLPFHLNDIAAAQTRMLVVHPP